MTKSILLVEDADFDANLTERALRAISICNPIMRATDGAQALDVLHPLIDADAPRAEIALVLLDLKLPKVDGFDVLKAIASKPLVQDVPIVIVTSSVIDSDRVRCGLLGARGYVAKAIDFDEFTSLLGLALAPFRHALS
jgi:two-component system response regulator